MKYRVALGLDWIVDLGEHDQAVPATAELQFGKSINKRIGVYVDGLVGIGTDRPYDWGIGTGIRFSY